LDPDKARELHNNGAAVLLLDVPVGTRVAFDQMIVMVAGAFKGWKMVPPGAHYLSYNAASRTGDFAPSVSVLCFLAGQQVLVRRWAAAQELLLPLEDEDEEQRFIEGFRRYDFDSGLAPYSLQTFGQWRALMAHVDEAAVKRLAPTAPNASVTAEGDPAAGRPPTAAEATLHAQLASGRPSGEKTSSAGESKSVGRCRYTQLPRLQKAAGLSAAQLTAQNMDKSELLRSLIVKQLRGQWQQLLAEFEVAFASFLYGQSLEGFAQWRDILSLAMSCEDAAVGDLLPLFVDLLRTLHAQLAVAIPVQGSSAAEAQPDADSQAAAGSPADAVGGLIEDLLPSSFLQQSIGGFLAILQEVGAPAPLAVEGAHLKELLQSRLGMSFDMLEMGASDDEDGPVVVEL